MPSTSDYALLADPPIALLTGAYRRFGNLVTYNKWNDLCQCNGDPSGFTCTYWTSPHPSSPATTTGSGGYWYGWVFTVNTTGLTSTGFEFYNPVAGSAYRLFLVDQGTGTILAKYDGHTFPSVGWNTYAYDGGPFALTNGHVYAAMIYGGAFDWTLPWKSGYSPTSPSGITINRQGYSLYNTSVSGTPSAPMLISAGICTSGGPPVIPPDPTPPPQPTGWPTYPGPAACSTVNDVCVAIGQVLAKLESLNNEVRIIQRYRVPFGLVSGTDHPGLTGAGSFSVGGLRGVRIRITSPTSPGTWPGNPPYVKDMGWVSIDDGSGMYAEKRVTQTSFLWLHEAMQLATTFQWALNPGVTIDVLELFPEP